MPLRVTRVAVAAVTALLAAGMANTTANAAEPADNCVVNVDSGSKQCFTTFRAAITASTHGRITNAPLSAKDIDQKLAERLTASSNGAQDQLGIVYKDSNYGGTSVTYSGSGCRSGNGRDYQFDITGSMDNAVSSLVTLSCWLELWDSPGTGGTHQEYQQSTSYVGDTMNDRASSIALL
ncbi:hypothetical protein AB0M39_08030 [Streptomyces sp. NPDC051907]|uniref:hypothetical protein n=1 Tax=Streptomyces sp. NPDC051907 TaxID=3155284 RepID=UPI003440589D